MKEGISKKTNVRRTGEKKREQSRDGWRKKRERKEENEEKVRTSAVSCRVRVLARDEVRAACWTLSTRPDTQVRLLPSLLPHHVQALFKNTVTSFHRFSNRFTPTPEDIAASSRSLSSALLL